MKVINLKKNDISCPCINGSKITTLCGIGDRTHQEEAMDENIGNFLNFLFCFALQLVYPLFNVV